MAFAPAPTFNDLGTYGATSANLNIAGTNIPQGNTSYGVMPGTTYAYGENMGGLVNSVPGTYNNAPGGAAAVLPSGQTVRDLPGPSNPTIPTQQQPPQQTPTNPNPTDYKGNVGDIVNNLRWNGHSWDPTGYVSSQQDAAAQQAAANIQAATNQYNNLRSQLETQRPVLDSAYQTGLGDLNNQLQLGQQQAQTNSAQLTSAYNAGMGTMGQQYQDSQAQNRELARAMGGNGSDYAQLQNRTNNSYQNNMFQSSNDYQTRLNQIGQGLQSLQQWGATQQHSLASQYQQGINQLVLNEDMTDFSKAQAIQQIQADYSKQLANIQSVVAQFGNQLQLASAQVQSTAAMFGKQIQGYDPLANAAQMYYGALGTPAPTVNSAGGITQPNKTAGGINSNNGAASF